MPAAVRCGLSPSSAPLPSLPSGALLAGLALGSACVPDTLPPVELGPYHPGTPTITDLAWDCDVDSAEWTFTVETEKWTGGGRLWMTRDHDRVEAHPILSDEADANGEWDRLELELDVATSWQAASNGSSTAWRCAEADDVSFLLAVYGPSGNAVGDCRTWGPQREGFDADEEIPACEVVLEEVDSGR